MRLIRPDDYRHKPWKNGGGETIEIAVSPNDAALGDFDWRISMARVAADGPFSMFPGIDRTLSILEGAGLEFNVEGDEPVRLTQGSPPHRFAGDRPASACLIGGPVVDLNVMSRRGEVSHRLRRFVLDARTRLDGLGEDVHVYCAAGQTAASSEGARAELAAGETLVMTGAGSWIVVEPKGWSVTIYLVEFWRSA